MSKKIGKILGIVVGNGIFALGLSAFSMPNHFLVGGATGIARSVQHFAHLDVSVTVAASMWSCFCWDSTFWESGLR